MLGENAKDEVLKSEGNAYFQRNLKNGKIEISKGCLLFDEFLENYQELGKNIRILEIGCCYGYNLSYLCKKYKFSGGGYGIEPSAEAVAYGQSVIEQEKVKVILQQGTADELKFQSEYFDIVMMAFCMFWIDRKYIMRAVAEADRVLKRGGILAIWDFDTRIPYRRINVHNANVPTYKCSLSELFLGNPQYYLIEKRSFSHVGKGFHRDMQERCALNVLYKDAIEDSYMFINQ